MAAEALGLAYEVTRTIESVSASGPAANELRAGDEINGISFRTNDPEDPAKEMFQDGKVFKLSDDGFDWMFAFESLQVLGPDAFVTLHFDRDGQPGTVELRPIKSAENMLNRGLVLKMKKEIYTAQSWGDALALGYRQTVEDATRVVTVLKKLVTGGLSPMNLVGPLSIVYVAGSEASQGLPRLLMFLTFLSANLAVLNFLPIPALDGGHMLFLIAEGIRGKPVDERMQVHSH